MRRKNKNMDQSLEIESSQQQKLKQNLIIQKPQIVERINCEKWFSDLQNKYLYRGFRKNYHSISDCLKSLFQVHNETTNIWTHIAGMLLALAILLYIHIFMSQIYGMESLIQNDLSRYQNDLTSQLFYSKNKNQICTVSNQNRVDYVYVQDFCDKILLLEKNDLQIPEFNQQQDRLTEVYNQVIQGNETQILKKLNDQVLYYSFIDDEIDQKQNIYYKIKNVFDGLIKQILSESIDYIPIYQQSFDINIPIRFPIKNEVQEVYHVSSWPLDAFQIASFFTFLFSVIFHTFNSLNKKAYMKLIRLDYAGIAILLSTGCSGIYYYAFFCEPFYFYLYIILALVLGLLVLVISMFDFIHQYKNHKLRTSMYGLFGLVLTIPTFQAILRSISIQEGVPTNYLNFGVSSYYYMGVLFFGFGGLSLYLLRIPERFSHKTFDIIGHSHNLWHVACLFIIVCGHMGSENLGGY
ncbi:hypothetical protein PPERSA_09935 [Pseudocohnilembus persalinus]|uniref:Hly-III-related n=1 Tax=Pseudocohnilembus persalinus TaxID=266149 RepID=A0A0V0QJC0_PSEPJ|nr:hypothetical protein PPERSA_09935 [Pseudocohnilembus persalinus]|eukprot:KRX02318.1 hypothetical protein PPERSA_09935 [Pseudocohnilembus persalinus]